MLSMSYCHKWRRRRSAAKKLVWYILDLSGNQPVFLMATKFKRLQLPQKVCFFSIKIWSWRRSWRPFHSALIYEFCAFLFYVPIFTLVCFISHSRANVHLGLHKNCFRLFSFHLNSTTNPKQINPIRIILERKIKFIIHTEF